MDRLAKTSDLALERLPELRKGGSRDSNQGRNGLPRTTSQGFPKLGREVNNYMSEDTEPNSDKHVGISREISKGISYLDVVSKVRDLEKKYIDLASSMDRRIQSFIEENPQKIIRHLKNIEDKESTLWKESQHKQLMLQDGLDFLKGSVKTNNDGIGDILNTVNRRLDDTEYRVANIMRGLDSVNKNKMTDRLLAISEKPFEQDQKIGTLEAEVRLLKEALNQERQRRDVFFQDIIQQYQEINNHVHQNENDLLSKIRKHKEDVIEENKRTKEQQKKLEEVKLEKLLGDSEYIRSLIRQVEDKVHEEVNKRLKHEFENKSWMEQKITLFKQEIKSDEKELLENEKKFLQNIQESMNSLSQIVTNTREQLEANIASTQTLFNENIKSLSKTVDLLKNNIYTKLNSMDVTVRELDQSVQDTKKSFHEHSIAVNETLDREFSRIEKVTLKFEDLMNENFKAQDEKFLILEENNKLWKKNFEDKNLRVLTEISNALKTLKGELSKEKVSTVERLGNLKNEIDSHQTANEKLFGQLNDRLQGVETTFEYKIEETYVKAAENLRHTADNLSQEIKKSAAATFEKAKKDTQSNITTLDQKLRGYTDTEIAKVRDELSKDNRNLLETYKVEVNREFTAVNVKFVDMQKQTNEEFKGVKSEIKYIHERLSEMGNEGRDKLKQVVDDIEGKIKLVYQNSRTFTIDKIKELRDDVNKSFNSQGDVIRNEVDLLKVHNGKLIGELHEKVRGEMGVQKNEISKHFEDLLEEERKVRASKDTEVANSVIAVKNMLMETINTKIESTQALARALVMEEAAERARSIESLTTTFKRRMDSVEKYFKELISTTVQEAKLELKELIRILEIKIEEQRVWTIVQLNIIVKDVEEFILQNTVKQYRDELFFNVAEKERVEQWRQIEEAFQVVGAKFEDIDGVRREDFEIIERKIFDMEDKNLLEHDAIYAKMHELNEERKYDNQERKFEIQELSSYVENQERAIKEVEQNLDEATENIYVMDDKFTNGLEDVDIKGQVRDYVNFLYTKTADKYDKGDDDEYKREIKKKLKLIDEQMQLIDERFDEDEKSLELFEQKTENNFKIAEKALLAHRDFINNVDARLTMEEMLSYLTIKNLEEKIANELASTNTQLNLVNSTAEEKLEAKLLKYQKKLEEDIIPHHLLKLEDNIRDQKQQAISSDTTLKDHYQQKISEHEIKLQEHEEALQKYSNFISSNVAALDQAKMDLIQEIERRDNLDREQTKTMQTTINKRLDDLNQRVDLLNGAPNSAKPSSQTSLPANNEKLKELETQIKSHSEKINDLEERVGKGPASSGAQDEQLRKELDTVKDTIAKMQQDVSNTEKTVKTEMDKAYNNQNDNHKDATIQLTKLFEQIQALEKKLDPK